MTSPLLARPFLLRSPITGDDVTNNCSNASAVTSRCDVTATSHSHAAAVTHVFVIVAVYSLLVGLLMLAIFVHDYVAHRRRHVERGGGGTVPMSGDAATTTDDRRCSTSDGDTSASQLERHDVTATTTQTVVALRVKVALLFFVFNFFYAGIEVGYAGLVMTYAVTYLHWSKDDGYLVKVCVAWNDVVSVSGGCVCVCVLMKQGRRYNTRVSAAGVQRTCHRAQRLPVQIRSTAGNLSHLAMEK